MNKQDLLKLLLFVLWTPMMVACLKKGSDDPLLSFRTRTDRLAGEWKLKKFTLDERNVVQTSINFNNTACDSLGIAGTETKNQTVNNEFEGQQLNSIVSNTTAGVGETFLYDIDIHYTLDIDKKGTYKCDGTYSYFDNGSQQQIDGGFSVKDNTWYWRNDNQEKSAVTFVNFPLIDVTAIASTSAPISYNDRTFNLLRLAHQELVIEYASLIQDTIRQISNPVVDTTIGTCIRRTTTITNVEEDAQWEFVQ
ncbi:MAG: hypothetical protein R3E32_02405 [Chitinophagales bacterium]